MFVINDNILVLMEINSFLISELYIDSLMYSSTAWNFFVRSYYNFIKTCKVSVVHAIDVFRFLVALTNDST